MPDEEWTLDTAFAFGGVPGASIYLQWKGTDACLDFECSCGANGHLDAEFAYALKCSVCGREWQVGFNIPLRPLPDDWKGCPTILVDCEVGDAEQEGTGEAD